MSLMCTLLVLLALIGVSTLQDVKQDANAEPTAEPKPEPPPQKCDIVAAVDCFAAMPELSEPHTITGDPLGEIVTPCQKQKEVYDTLKKCLPEALAGCPTIWKDSQVFIQQSEGFCTEVTKCTTFPSSYRMSLGCSHQMFSSIMAQDAPANMKKICTDLSACMKTHIAKCPALSMFLEEQWSLFGKTCAKAEVLPPAELTMEKNITQPMAVCPKLIDVTTALKSCHDAMMSSMAGTKNVTIHCIAAKDFIDCAKTNLAQGCPVTSGYQEILEESLKDYTIGLTPFCGSNMTTEAVCNIGDMPACFSTVDLNMWKVENYIIEGTFGDANKNITEIVAKASQITSMARDVATMCQKVNETLTPVESCLAQETQGCNDEVKELYQMNTKYLRNLCKDFNSCGNFTAMSAGLGVCTDTATKSLNDLQAKGITDTQVLQDTFCKIFDDMMLCMDTFLLPLPCYKNSEYMHVLYSLLADDLSAVCQYSNFSMIKNITLGDEMEEFVECSDMPQVSYEIGLCTNVYLQTLAQNATQPDVVCSALNEWQKCSLTAAHDCDMLYFHLKDMGETARMKLESCIMPTMPPVTEPPSTDTNTTNTGTQSIVTDKEGNIIVRTTPSSIGAVTTPSLMILLLGLVSAVALEIVFN